MKRPRIEPTRTSCQWSVRKRANEHVFYPQMHKSLVRVKHVDVRLLSSVRLIATIAAPRRGERAAQALVFGRSSGISV